ncbi:hypothetical protein V496_07592 [Pseudogymnoascus sp. VKM F-4515 (FW-2607)]|nr:hypothetical protein V496_07592 [Pseudogymnoascus sp. VKM F-4515 (FW-2607)]KFY90282.1 hypothetical protein V498_06075 [Pseudogymnoascus sp. VKM F-4517 (FW-2822)]
MSPTIFVTGVSGYIGGHTVSDLIEKHPEYQVITLVRTEKQAGIIKATWPAVETVLGDLDNHDLLVEQGKRADVILQLASSDHAAAAKALIEGLSQGKKGRYIHISGTGILHDVSNGFGNPSSKIYHDVADILEITSFNSTHVHRDTDAAVIASGEQLGISTAIVTPCVIYGIGKGPINNRSFQVPVLVEETLKRGRPFAVGAGNNIWDHIHISDLSAAFGLLAEEALKPAGGAATWGPEGYYFVEAGEHSWAEVGRDIAAVVAERGIKVSAEVEQFTVEDVAKVHPWAPLLWGGNARSRAERLRGLGWKPVAPSLKESLGEIVDVEIKALEAKKA